VVSEQSKHGCAAAGDGTSLAGLAVALSFRSAHCCINFDALQVVFIAVDQEGLKPEGVLESRPS